MPARLASLDADQLEPHARAKLERALDLSVWIDIYRPEIVV